jgi:hypothetical protein
MPPVQTSYDDAPAIAYAGMLATGGTHDVDSNVVETDAITAGLVVLKGTADGQARPILATDELTADTDAILTVQPSATTKQTIVAASLDGAVGDDAFWPPRNATATFNNHGDWNDTDLIIRGLGAFGEPAVDVLKVPEGGNATVTGTVIFSQITQVEIPPGTSTNGTVDVGLGVAMGPLDRRVLGVAIYDAAKAPGAYADEEAVPVLRRGRIYVTAEAAVAKGDPVYVRVVAGVGETRGRVRATPDSTDCALLRGARFVSTTTAEGLAVVELDLPTS